MLAWFLDRGHGHEGPRLIEGWAKNINKDVLSNEFSEVELARIRDYQGPHPFVYVGTTVNTDPDHPVRQAILSDLRQR
jgi:hypothetical protein